MQNTASMKTRQSLISESNINQNQHNHPQTQHRTNRSPTITRDFAIQKTPIKEWRSNLGFPFHTPATNYATARFDLRSTGRILRDECLETEESFLPKVRARVTRWLYANEKKRYRADE